MPSRQRLHWPQPAWISTATRWPIETSSTPGPSATTVPMYSCPGVKFLLNGRPPWIIAGVPYAMTSRSVAQIATASMRTSTSARPGAGTGFCFNASSPGSPSIQAFMCSGIGNSRLVCTPVTVSSQTELSHSSRAAAGAARLVHDLKLHLLDLGEALPLPGDQVIHLLVQVPDLELRLEVDAVIAFRPQPVLGLEALLAHHDDGSLDRGEARQDQVEQNIGIGIEALAARYRLVEYDPHRQPDPEDDDEGPAAAEAREVIGHALAQAALVLEFGLDVLGDGVVPGDALRHLAIELGELAVLGLQQFLDIERPIPRDFRAADQRLRPELGMVRTDAVGQARAQGLERNQVAARPLSTGDGADRLVGFSFGCGGRARAGLDVGHAATPRVERANLLLVLRQRIFARKPVLPRSTFGDPESGGPRRFTCESPAMRAGLIGARGWPPAGEKP